MLPLFSPFDKSFLEDRYAVYRRYQMAGGIHWGAPAIPTVPGSWYLFGYQDIQAALQDPRFIKESPIISREQTRARLAHSSSALWELTTRWALLSDPPRHTPRRSVLQKGLRAHCQPNCVPRIAEIARKLASDLPERGTFDLIAEFAMPFPIRVICELLGVPAEYEKAVRRWSQAIFLAIDFKTDAANYQAGSVAAREVSDVLRDLIAYKRRHPKDDIISTILADEESRQLSDDELVANVSLLLFAGNETTVGLIGNGVLTLLQHPAQRQRLDANADLRPSAVEEILRFESPVQATSRFAAADLTFAGENIRKGDLVCLMFGAANRDPRQFVDPESFDIGRSPNRHLGFGYGAHFCVGAALGVIEGQIALQTLLHDAPQLQLQMDSPEWHDSVAFHSLRHLLVSR